MLVTAPGSAARRLMKRPQRAGMRVCYTKRNSCQLGGNTIFAPYPLTVTLRVPARSAGHRTSALADLRIYKSDLRANPGSVGDGPGPAWFEARPAGSHPRIKSGGITDLGLAAVPLTSRRLAGRRLRLAGLLISDRGPWRGIIIRS